MKVINLYKTYPIKKGEKVHALKGVSFDLPDTGMVAILGKSGCGKSTLLNILGGLDRFDSGDVECFGKSLKSLSRKELDDYRNSCVGFVFQEYHLIPELNVGDNIALALQLQGQTDAEEKVQAVLKQVDLSGYEKRKIEELSGGQKQRVAIARALVKEPKIIFADEPTGALDSHTGERILQILKGIAQERLVVLVTHDREFAEKYGDRVIELEDGLVIGDTAEAYQSKESVQARELRKSKMPVKTAVKIGCSNFKHHPFRLFSTILLSVIAFSLLGISLTIAFMDPAKAFAEAMIRDGIEFSAIYKKEHYENPNEIDQSLDQFLGEPLTPSRDLSMTIEDAEFLQSKFDISYALVYTDKICSFQNSVAATLKQMQEAALAHPDTNYLPHANGFIALSEEECDRLGYTVIGRLPQNTEEIAINECIYNVFTIAGLLEEEQLFEISAYEDIIGHKITIGVNAVVGQGELKTITGVVVTGCDRACFAEHCNPEERIDGWDWETYHDKIFVCQDFFEEWTYALCSTPQSKAELTKMIRFIMDSDDPYVLGEFYTFTNPTVYGCFGAVSVASMMKMLALYLSILFLLFAMLLLSNFIFTSMRRQMKQIGILSALGAGFKDLCTVYGSAIVAMCSVIASITLVLQIFGVGWFNTFLKTQSRGLTFDLVSFSLPAILILIFIMAVVAAAGCLIPLRRLQKMEPTTIINKGQIK